MNRDELKQLITGPIATVPTPFGEQMQLDLARMTDLTRWWVEQGLGTSTAPIKVAAAGGEGPDLSDDEWPHLLHTAVSAAGSDAVIVCGLKPKNTLHTIEDAKKAQDLGAVSLQIDLPFMHHSNQDDYVRFFTDISDAIEIGIIIYNTYWFGCESITADTMLRLADAEHVVALKWQPSSGQSYEDMLKFAHIFNVIDNSRQAVRCHKNGGRGYINPTVAVYPQYHLELWQHLEAKRYEEAQAMYDRLQTALKPFEVKSKAKSGGYRVLKGMMAVMGQPVGPPRPPTLPLDEEELAELREILKGLGWPVA